MLPARVDNVADPDRGAAGGYPGIRYRMLASLIDQLMCYSSC